MSTAKLIYQLAQVDILKEGKVEENFVGRPFYLDYDKAFILINDYWKSKVNGVPQGTFLLAFYDNEDKVSEALLLRALKPTKLPTDNDVISSMIEYYKDNLSTSGKGNQLDQFTKYEFSFSGLECRVLGTFYKVNDKLEFGADVENFFSPNNYRVFKASDQVLMQIVNQRDRDIIAGNENEFEIGFVRYSSSRR
ncbi:MAG: ATPase, partial [Ignavibacteria bacterium]|nr:ATPase [Ignavibacteria bacterium]